MVYRPVETRAIQWARVLKAIAAAGVRGISVSGLADALELDSVTPELEKALEMLRRSGRIRDSIGRAENRQPCHYVQVNVTEPGIRESRD